LPKNEKTPKKSSKNSFFCNTFVTGKGHGSYRIILLSDFFAVLALRWSTAHGVHLAKIKRAVWLFLFLVETRDND
jgi:hypothetical protein